MPHPKYKLTVLMSKEEGYGLPGALPTRNNNPLDLRHSPHSSHPGDPNAIGKIDTVEHGWEDADRQLEIYASRGLTLRQMVEIFAPSSENNTSNYLRFCAEGLGVPPDTPVSDCLKILA